ncbi:MAG: hypothetical protein H0U66_12505 [Gemmatimonadaceae bacterium]|nr:hypothetical protein [Gemmatimonadaceae bacterium]
MSSPAHKNGFRYGGGRFFTESPLPEPLALVVPGVSIAADGFELLAGDGAFVSWFACVLDACEALKRSRGAGKVVRCSDRALIKSRRRA